MNKRLVADVGGTNTRIALYDVETGQFRALKTYLNREYARFDQVIEAWLDTLNEPAPVHGCIAVAAAPSEDKVTMLNMDWAFSCSEIASRFGFERFKWINDFAAIAYALPYLEAANRRTLHAGEPANTGKLAAVGPGTGLGGATIEEIDGDLHASACEPGHMSLAPASEMELKLFRLLMPRFGNIYAELLCSGPGLQRLYEALCELRQIQPDAATPLEVSARALRGDDKHCIQALELFCGMLGSICGDFVLANGAYRGLYLAGGIIPAIIPFLAESSFHDRFCDKGAMKDYLNTVPVYVITDAQPGLIGAAHAPVWEETKQPRILR